jgi:hypothetical protein
MNDKKFKHRAIAVGEFKMTSLCESCIHMPSGKIPMSNEEVLNGTRERPHMYCLKKAFFPSVNYNNEGKPFYDVAKCDGWEVLPELLDKVTSRKEIEIKRPEENE